MPRGRLDVIKVQIEEVNTEAIPFPIAKCRDIHTFGLIHVDISVGPVPKVGEFWWLDRQVGKWRLSSLANSNSTNIVNPTLGNINNDLFFQINELKTELEFIAFAKFYQKVQDQRGSLSIPNSYVIEWMPCDADGIPIDGEHVRQKMWIPSDTTNLDDDGWYTVRLEPITRPKKWYWKVRVAGINVGVMGKWNDWSKPVLCYDVGRPTPPWPNIDLRWRIKYYKESNNYQAIISFNDVGWWDIEDFDYQDDVKEYNIELQPLVLTQRYNINTDTWDSVSTTLNVVGPDIVYPDVVFKRVSNKDAPLFRTTITDIDEDEESIPEDADLWTPLGLLLDNPHPANPTGIDEYSSTLIVDETDYEWPIDPPEGNFVIRIANPNYDDGLERPSTEYEHMYVVGREAKPEYGLFAYQYQISRSFTGIEETDRDIHLEGSQIDIYYPDHKYHAVFNDIPRPKAIYWRARARSIDRFNRQGLWSPWTYPEKPNIESAVIVPPDANLRLRFDKFKTSNYRAIVLWDEIKTLEVEHSDDTRVNQYQIDLATSDRANVRNNVSSLEGNAIDITDAQWDSSGGGTVTYTTAVNHGLVDNDHVRISNVIPSEYNGYFKINQLTTTTFSVTVDNGDNEHVPTSDYGGYQPNVIYTVERHYNSTQASEHSKDSSVYGNMELYGHLIENVGESDTSINVAESITWIPDAPFTVIVEGEEMYVTAKTVQNVATVVKIDDTVDVTEAALSKQEWQDMLPCKIRIEDEIMELTDVTGGSPNLTFTVQRGQVGTEMVAHTDGNTQRIWQYPYEKNSISAKNDDDRNKRASVLFKGIENNWYYQTRIRFVDIYGRISEWSDWTDPEQCSF